MIFFISLSRAQLDSECILLLCSFTKRFYRLRIPRQALGYAFPTATVYLSAPFLSFLPPRSVFSPSLSLPLFLSSVLPSFPFHRASISLNKLLRATPHRVGARRKNVCALAGHSAGCFAESNPRRAIPSEKISPQRL